MSARVFGHSYRVTYAECTVGNHVYYGRYLDFLERARGEFFRSLNWPMVRLQDQEIIFPVTQCRLQYLAPARYDDGLLVEVWVESMRRVRVLFGYRILSEDGRILVRAETEHACTDLQDKPARIPEPLAAQLEAYLKSSPHEHDPTPS